MLTLYSDKVTCMNAEIKSGKCTQLCLRWLTHLWSTRTESHLSESMCHAMCMTLSKVIKCNKLWKRTHCIGHALTDTPVKHVHRKPPLRWHANTNSALFCVLLHLNQMLTQLCQNVHCVDWSIHVNTVVPFVLSERKRDVSLFWCHTFVLKVTAA